MKKQKAEGKRQKLAKNKIVLFLAILFLKAAISAHAQDSVSLDSLIKEARENSPEIITAKKHWEAASARVPQAKSLNDPVIGINFEKIPRGSLKLNKTMPNDRMLSFSQMFPFIGKLPLKGKIAAVEAQIAAVQYKDKELKVISEVKNAYYDLFMNYKEIELNEQGLELLKGIAKIAEAKYAVGSISQEEVFKINLELARLNTNIVNLKQENWAKSTRLNTLLNRDAESPLGMPSLAEDVSFNQDVKSLYQATLLNQPELIIFSYAIEKNRFAKSLAKKSFFPDFMAGVVERGLTTGAIGPWDLMLSFTVPLWFWTKERYEVKEAIANLEEAESASQAMQNRAFSEVKELTVKIEAAKNKINLFKNNLMPMLESSISVSMAGFRSGKTDLMTLLDNIRMLVETEMSYYRALVEYNMNLSDLERIVGVNMNEVKK